ncbi:hypothetical protein N0V82_004181 [Gnomoniopsis sp. IMI 355080]|nr:hypothetical protein N0V82_004181 [Gnomoniopsis sp. IMI 355080]
MFPRVAGPRRLAGISFLVFLTWAFALWIFLPYDSPFVLFLQFTSSRVSSFFHSPADDERLLLEQPGRFPFTDDEVAYIIKTGYGTQERVPALLEASKSIGIGTNKYEDKNILVVGDFAGELEFQGRPVVVHDMVAAVMEHETVVQTQTKNTERMQKYANMTLAIQEGRTQEAATYSKAVGWELDALKAVWKQMPGKKWYVMQDDDTFILRPSLYRFLEHLDPSRDFYLGNAVGDYKGRFAHGGSSFILSNGAMIKLLDQNPELVSQAYVESLDEVWGDKLVATTLIKVGIYLSERYRQFFNGEPPLITKVSADRICSPIVSFHGLAQPEQMTNVGRTFAELDKPVFWRDLWRIYGEPGLDTFDEKAIRLNHDHVGRQDDADMRRLVESADKCVDACKSLNEKCLAWTWDKQTQTCLMSPWVIVGNQSEGKYSGLNVKEVRKVDSQCGKHPY